MSDSDRSGKALRVAMIGTRGLPATHGGVERAVEALSKGLAARGHDVTVYGRRGYCGNSLGGEFGSVRQVVLPAANTKHLEAITHTIASTLHASLGRRYDIVHFHATGPAMFSAAMRLQGVPTVATIHALDWRREKWGTFATAVLRLAARLSVTVPTETVVVSRHLQQELSTSYGAATTHIPNGVDFDDLDSDPVTVAGLISRQFILFLGRLVPEKQPHLLIQAFRKLDTDMKLVIAGPEIHETAYEARLRNEAHGDSRIVFVGPRYGGDKAWLLRNARVFVQPSTLEGFPIAPLEALASGTEVLVSDIAANIEAVTMKGNRYARVFRVGDVQDLHRSLAHYAAASDPLAADARVVAREMFDWAAIAVETERVYRRAVELRASRDGSSRREEKDFNGSHGVEASRA